jgi:hypothetical protein
MWVPSGYPILLVTFNYDRMLEKVLEQFGHTLTNIDNYVRHDRFKLFKLHGSVNWGRRVLDQAGPLRQQKETVRHLIDSAASLKFANDYWILEHSDKTHDDKFVFFPALALPVEKKVDFECPASHVNVLRQHLKNVTRILTIGWRGSEAPFLDMLNNSLSGPVPLMVVAGGDLESSDIGEHLESKGIASSVTPYPGGFSDFAPKRDGEKFLRY